MRVLAEEGRRSEAPAFAGEGGFTSYSRSAEHGFTPPRRSAEHGFTCYSRSAEHGFTLVEMMVALAIFGLVAAAGVGLLAFAVRAQAAASARLDEGAALRRMDALLVADLTQAVPRTTRGLDGTIENAFTGDGGAGTALGLVRGGWSNPGGGARASLQKVAWRVADGALVRQAWPMLDGAQPGEAATIVRGVKSFAVRYRQADGEWRARWDATRATALPRLIEVTIAIGTAAPVTATYLVGTGA